MASPLWVTKSLSDQWTREKAEKLIEEARRNPFQPFQQHMYDSHIFNLKILFNIILQEHLSKSATEIDVLAKEIKEYEIIQTIPGIREKIAATIISEIGR